MRTTQILLSPPARRGAHAGRSENVRGVEAEMDGEGMKEPNYDQDMKLPEGKTCDLCFAFRFCNGIGCTWAGRTECDYWPNRFMERVKE